MKKWFRRLVYRTETEKFNPLMHPFMLITAATGFAFVFFADTDTVEASVLFKLTRIHMQRGAVSLWGVLAMIAVLLVTINVLLRWKWAGLSSTFIGYSIWLYALILYMVYGYWLQVFGAAVPSLYFWVWHHFRVHKYYRLQKAGYIDEPRVRN